MSTITKSAQLFAALGDSTRLRIIITLRAQPNGLCTSEVTATTTVTRQATTKHLERLTRAGMLASKRKGRERIWFVTPRAKELFRDCLAHLL